jgi:hypothetical protein
MILIWLWLWLPLLTGFLRRMQGKYGRIPAIVNGLLAGTPWLLVDFWPALVVAILAWALWNGAPFLPHHVFTGAPGSGWEKQCIKRYGPVAFGWIWADRYWPKRWTVPWLIDGPTSAGEILAGIIFGTINLALALLVWRLCV